MKKRKPKYSMLERIAIAVCLFACIFSLAVTVLVINVMCQIEASAEPMEGTQQVEILPENTTATENTENIPDATQATSEPVEMQTETCDSSEQNTEASEETIPETTVTSDEDIENLNDDESYPKGQDLLGKNEYPKEDMVDNLSEWFLDNQTTDAITLWKRTDSDGALLIALKREGEVLAIFKYEQADYEWLTTTYNEWTLCENIFGETSTRDIVDYGFVAYHEVGGKNPENVQAQVCVVGNRENCEYFANTTRGVVTAEFQYACAPSVVARRLKDFDRTAEEEDLEKCFRQVLLVLAGELIEEVPENVVFAASGPQGSGVWKIIDGTYYCYINY